MLFLKYTHHIVVILSYPVNAVGFSFSGLLLGQKRLDYSVVLLAFDVGQVGVAVLTSRLRNVELQCFPVDCEVTRVVKHDTVHAIYKIKTFVKLDTLLRFLG